jgi:enamine deaminase RidA (YjgF/YER057c/UK114 family)
LTRERIKSEAPPSASILKFVKSKKAPEPIGPYSQAVVVKNLVFVSGMIAVDPATGKMVTGGAKEQTERALSSLKAVLKEAGLRRRTWSRRRYTSRTARCSRT